MRRLTSPVGLLALSLALIVIAGTTLVIGWFNADSALTGASITASVAAGVLLPVAWYESRRVAKRGVPPEELER